MYGQNPARPPVKGDGLTLDVQHIFATLQGEGPYAGMPAVFIRLGGCNLACAFCDTEFESFTPTALEEIITRVEKLARPCIGDNVSPVLPSSQRGGITLIVITGGEPLRQPISPLCEALLAAGYRIQLETNGTLWRDLPEAVEIVCSPKNNGGGYVPLRPDLLARVNAFKFIVSARMAGYDAIADVGQGSIPVFVQPMDENDAAANAANLALAISLAQMHGYRLSLQLHKIIGME